MESDPYAHVPLPDIDAAIDPQWLGLTRSTMLPSIYLPPAMAGPRPWLSRLLAAALVAVFLLATSAGVCLTYGPDVFGGL